MLRISSFINQTESNSELGAEAKADITRPDPTRRKRSAVGNQQQNQTKSITLSFHVEEYDVVLVEKMDDINCLALILNVSFSIFLTLFLFHIFTYSYFSIISKERNNSKNSSC